MTHVDSGIAMFPDAPTTRGTKHLMHLVELSKQGFECGVLFIVQRSDALSFRPFWEIDPLFSEQLSIAKKHGVRVLAYSCQVDETGVSLDKTIGLRDL